MRHRLVAVVAALVALTSPALADYVVRDGAGATQTFGSFDLSGVKLTKHALVDPTTGQAVGVPSNPLTVRVVPRGSTGADFSVNAAAVPVPGYVLLQTIPATPTRAFVEVQNQSANTIQVVRDDGAGNNVTTVLLAGTGAGQQGGGWSSSTFEGRVRVYGPTGSQIAAYQD